MLHVHSAGKRLAQVGLAFLGDCLVVSFVTKRWRDSQHLGLAPDDRSILIAPVFGEPTLKKEKSFSSPWGSDYHFEMDVDGVIVGTRWSADSHKLNNRYVQCIKSGCIQAVQGSRFQHLAFLGHHDVSHGCLEVGTACPSQLV